MSATSATAPLDGLRDAVREAALAVRAESRETTGGAAEPRLERPKRAGQGDYSTNAAMLLAPALGTPPREVAERLSSALAGVLGPALDRTEVAGPGFLNLFMADDWYQSALAAVLAAGEQYGSGGAASAQRILVEFVSANPTGPLVAASGRHAAYGDALARILTHHGHTVAREYYFNDAGGQIRRLGVSVQARARGEDVPEDGYQGDYVADLATEIADAASLDVDSVAARAVELLLDRIKATLERFGVRFDTFFSERVLHEGSPSPVERVLSELEAEGRAYRSEGALWLRTSAFGDHEDRVVVRSNGEPTYFAADLAYMLDKRARGFDLQLDPVGSDHHGWAISVKAGMAALGGDPDTIEVPLIQFVHLAEGGERAAMSKRRGEFVTLDELLDEIGVDVCRYFMLQRSHDRTLDLDLSLARQQTRDNPVYYIQYAHARIASMLRRLSPERVSAAVSDAGGWGSDQLHPSERALVMRLAAFPDDVAEAAERRAPHRIASFALELAQDFTAFYRDCHVVGATPEATESFRIALSAATQRTIATSLGLLGVSAPESM
ncbi:MAG TPA: arginine--tRNA ligase [Solirubrobacteraceae bacterium]|jgi:arginyl-tRNA synthetase|nr:arginine--tRNA ligase [Solirubrobacteraceae bacterium]